MNRLIKPPVGNSKLGQYTAIRTNIVRSEAPRSRTVVGEMVTYIKFPLLWLSERDAAGECLRAETYGIEVCLQPLFSFYLQALHFHAHEGNQNSLFSFLFFPS